MKVIIKKTGEVKEVSLGHAVNFLLPQGLALVATKKKLKELESNREAERKAKQVDKVDLRRQAEKIDGKVVEFEQGSISKKDIADKLKIDKNYVVLGKAIKKPGEYEVKLAFGKSVAKVKVKVKD
ncbi:MAG: 50S ribosomal protein L9 [Candidatus Beckwithbacteria bacterium GW2011_GWB1_47_15]|uniref:Large ribosomal subunit protein bL9 n=1 Tax=Candidatus Beckwithbacteria bacterium GW2011_GWB1_47_15 TaxID=1618371 RepID=A0A0G1U512_9BACT|nr:MAG: ribosomal protein L9P [Candidatus Beckwithbacteria bacterium GW2011_GWC1_49_16]KKU35323.1 MAG: 50S ribosomal protein L9 [Candidatus Beckwithbacteria bacterium GW2011_GWA1_46_30]KKU61418.1 MAG: 50S ribosomal protein L9 [Candidatus Beckwithbacteria bacterium GW2011_GWB1_47_15]KKU71825.1 MAG: 50S ribosomal protein L9 [Candidatus Beckwithbacteria bacterium GW2011_GWA2_47_25]KKW03719.1 MAG: 50S ribosomal protein L9 [Candidatus Beckwithbacteria bacterium GW2011_GWC2_49_11]OGD48770.1 MAG: hyp